MSSKIEAAILAATEIVAKRNEDRQEYLTRLVRGVSSLSEDAWNKLPREAQEWFNGAADAMNVKTPLADFPDLEAAADAPAPVARRGAPPAEAAKAEETKAADPKVGDTVLLTDARGNEYQGPVKEIDSSEVVIVVDGADESFRMSKVKSIKVLSAGGSVQAEPAKADAPKAEPAKADAPKAEPAKADAPKADAKPTPPKRDPSVKPVTQVMREVICGNIGKTKDEVAKVLDGMKIEYKPSTLDIMFSDTVKTIDTLKALGALK